MMRLDVSLIISSRTYLPASVAAGVLVSSRHYDSLEASYSSKKIGREIFPPLNLHSHS